MSNLEEDFLNEIDKLQEESYIQELGLKLGIEYEEMIKGTYGDEIVKTGRALLSYVFDLFLKDIGLGMEAIKVIFSGYLDLPHTDLYAPYYDSVTTRRLWYRATEVLDMGNHLNSSLTLNTYFRWYSTTYELFRKMLIFDCYCHGLYSGHEINVKNYLFGTKDPGNNLDCSGSKDRKVLVEFYDSTIRHSISHGNILVIPNHFIVIRQTDGKKENVIEKIYDNPDDFILEVTKNIEIMYGAVRFFYFIISDYLFTKYSNLFTTYVGNLFTDRVLIAMVRSIQANTANPVY